MCWPSKLEAGLSGCPHVQRCRYGPVLGHLTVLMCSVVGTGQCWPIWLSHVQRCRYGPFLSYTIFADVAFCRFVPGARLRCVVRVGALV